MGVWLAKYWLEVLFGFIVVGIGAFFKYFWKLVKKDREQHEQNILTAIKKEMDQQQKTLSASMDERDNRFNAVMEERDIRFREEDNRLHAEIDGLRDDFKIIKGGILSIQGRDFKADCRMLLQPEHMITLNEFEAIIEEHEVYKSLGGNHEGDALFTLVEQKYGKQLESDTNGYK